MSLHEDGDARSAMLIPAIVTTVLVVTLVPAAAFVLRAYTRRRDLVRRSARDLVTSADETASEASR